MIRLFRHSVFHCPEILQNRPFSWTYARIIIKWDSFIIDSNYLNYRNTKNKMIFCYLSFPLMYFLCKEFIENYSVHVTSLHRTFFTDVCNTTDSNLEKQVDEFPRLHFSNIHDFAFSSIHDFMLRFFFFFIWIFRCSKSLSIIHGSLIYEISWMLFMDSEAHSIRLHCHWTYPKIGPIHHSFPGIPEKAMFEALW